MEERIGRWMDKWKGGREGERKDWRNSDFHKASCFLYLQLPMPSIRSLQGLLQIKERQLSLAMRPLRFSSPGNCTALQVQIPVKSFLFGAVRGHDPGSTSARLSGRPDTRSTMNPTLLLGDRQLLLSPQRLHTPPVPHFTLFAAFLTVSGYSLSIDFS